MIFFTNFFVPLFQSSLFSLFQSRHPENIIQKETTLIVEKKEEEKWSKTS